MKIIKLKSNLLSGILFVALALILWFLIPSQIEIPHNATVVSDPSFFPKVFSLTLLIIGGVMVFISTVFHKETVVNFEVSKQLNMLLYLGMMILFVVLMNFIGFLISAIIFGISSLVFFRCKKTMHYIVVIVSSVVVYVGFKYLLGISLP